MTQSAQREVLWPYVPRLLEDWLATAPDQRHRCIGGTAVFCDLSGFTQLTERLSRHGRIGAEEMSDALNATFTELLTVADDNGADLVKWGGDAVMLLFDGPGHEARACQAAYGMRGRLRQVGHLRTTAGTATLRMSTGVASGQFHFFLVGDPDLHRELVICGPDVSRVVQLEGLAHSGEIAVGPETIAAVGEEHFGAPVEDLGRLLRRLPMAAPPHRLERAKADIDLRQFVPIEIRRHLLLGFGEPEHRAIAVAFVHFTGTDAMLREEGPEATADALDEVVRNVSQAVAEFEVSFHESDVNVDGGKIMLTAGAPRRAGHDVDRMLRATRLAMDRVGRLRLRIGVNAGPVFSGDFGPPFRRTYSVKGDAINLAARVMGKAQFGQVLVTADAYDHSSTVFEIEHLEPFRVKGKSQPVQAYALGRVRQARGTASTTSQLVGRVDELDVLIDRLAMLRAREGAVVEVIGEPGIGKSRLISELRAQADNLMVLAVECDEYASSTPYHPIRALLRDLIGIREQSDPLLAIERLNTRLAFDAPHLVPWLPLLAIPLGLPVSDTPETAGLEDQFRKRRLEEVVLEVLHTLLPTPTLITLDDTQHMDGASADLLTHLTSLRGKEPWLFVVGRRDSALGWQPPDTLDLTTLRLDPLSADESLELVQVATDDNPLPRPALEALAARADGNPLFLQSLVAAAGSSGRIDDLPESVEELVTTQIDQLAPGDRTVLRHASVLGMRFDKADLEVLLSGTSVRPVVATYERLREFLEPELTGQLRFRHAMMRDVAYEGLPYRRRRLLHDQVGTALEESGRAATEGPEMLSVHFFHAHHYEKAWRYSCEAGHLARAKYAHSDAAEFFRRAVTAQTRGPEGMVSAHELGNVLETLADTLYTMGLLSQAGATYKEARRQFAGDPSRAAKVASKESDVDRRLRRLPQSLRRVTAALNRIPTDDHTKEASVARSQLASRYAMSRMMQGKVEDALAWDERAAREAEESTDKPTLALAYAILHMHLVNARRTSDLPYGEMALEAYAELDDLSGQGRCLNNLAVSALDHNQWVEAAEMFGRAYDIYRRIGDTAAEANSLFNKAEVLVKQGHWAEARPLLAQVITAARAVQDDELVALALREAGRAGSRLGDFERADLAFADARRIFERIDEREELPGTDVAIAEGLLQRGDADAALKLIGSVRDVDAVLEPTLHWVRGFALLAMQQRDDAAAAFREGVTAGQREDDRFALAMSNIGLSELVPTNGASESARAELSALGVVTLPIRLGAPAGSA